VELTGNTRVSKARLEINKLSGEPFQQSARGTGKFTELEAGIVFRSIGYKGTPIAGLPFDEKRGVIPNQDGRITGTGGIQTGLYTAGWIKRGPSGIIGTNRADSVATVQSLLQDLDKLNIGAARGGADAATRLLNDKGVRYITFEDWGKIDRSEIARGQPKAKPREKYTRVSEMLGVIDG
jgi:ferredoxin--NADP+ reductase